jgi:mannose-6-phosphate isomerase-like protein (cupin superfamily)
LATLGASASLKEDGTQPSVFHAPAEIVTAKLRTGGLLLDARPYKVDAGRRTAPGEVEFHTSVTDIMYVLEGAATVVTGGEMVDRRQVGPGEYRASATRGGTSQRLARGDVMVIPAGVPHWFKEVPGPLSYYVVKVVEP